VSRIYVASSWRNAHHADVVELLQNHGHKVYDFKNPAPGEHGFAWSDIDTHWEGWRLAAFRESLEHPIAQHGFWRDMQALKTCEACVLVLPCGRSAHLELGWAVGAGKRTAVFQPDAVERQEPELMYRMVGLLTGSPLELVRWLAKPSELAPEVFR
jgi:hypothetical protein